MNQQPATVTPIDSKQPAPAAKFTISASIEGFPVSISIEGNANSLRALVDRLRSIGAEPPVAQVQAPEPPKIAPTCPIHGTPMKPSQKPGSHFCPKKNDDGSYCRHKA